MVHPLVPILVSRDIISLVALLAVIQPLVQLIDNVSLLEGTQIMDATSPSEKATVDVADLPEETPMEMAEVAGPPEEASMEMAEGSFLIPSSS